MGTENTRTIAVDYLARVEGEGALYVKVRGDHVVDVELRIFEPPRFFEAFLRGRSWLEAPDIAARICGICPVAYQMSAVHAMERIAGVEVGGHLRELRRLLYCGEWIESHVLHIFLLHAPDFLGYPDAMQMAADHKSIVEKGLELKKHGNAIVNLLGGREVHPINVKVGGFYKLPDQYSMRELEDQIKRARDLALDTVRWTSSLEFPGLEIDHELVCNGKAGEYPMNEGRIVSSAGLDIAVDSYDENFIEEQVEHSNALQSRVKGRGAYLTGPLARFNLNFELLHEPVKQAAREAGVVASRNPFQSIVIRALEVFYACEEALRILRDYDAGLPPAVDVDARAGTGYACTEAPRGILYQRFSTDAQGQVTDAKIVPPTSQNQLAIEQDLGALVPQHLDKTDDELTHLCEQAIRNYDPCISCATHFLKLELDRGPADA
ncbi:MAG: Ni/Fe hydrogenase subunit alpha [Gammaproteobacteria bacterium]|nr:Ni/Fe hydrogenase subunit alpha [Gammaproteobacteria bacterium]